MSLGDFKILEQQSLDGRGSRVYNVAAAATAILAGEPVARALGAVTVTQMATNKPVVGTDFIAGIAVTSSSQTSSVAGTVTVLPLNSQTTYLVKPNNAANWDTQAEYDALVGKRVLVDLTAGAFTLLSTDSAANGLIVAPLDISKYPGMVAVVFRQALSDMQ